MHALDLDTGAIVWQNTAEPDADASFAPTSAIPGVIFVGGASSGSLRAYDAASGVKLGSTSVTVVLAAGAAVVDGHVLVGGGVGERSGNPTDPADVVSRIPQSLTALCVPGTPACDEDQDGVDFPDDCDDRNPQRSPRAREVGGNDVDEDCDGVLAGPKDACLGGGSAPQDRRDLGALQTAGEATCPCATFASRSAHRRCMRRVTREALDAGTLRRTCKPVVTHAASTCGRPGSAICCTASAVVQQAVVHRGRAARCADTRKLDRTVATGATSCLDVDCDVLVPVTTTTTTTPGATTTTTTLPPPGRPSRPTSSARAAPVAMGARED